MHLGLAKQSTQWSLISDAGDWIWVVISGAITLILGLVILARWPVSSVYALGIFLGIDLMIAGASWISIGLDLRARARR
jgi:uncharacterized membrane protein HdeD (DUF308 family)